MKKIIITLFLCSFALITSCSKSPGKTVAKFRMGISAIVDITNVGAAGAMLWGRSDSGEMFGTVITPSTSLDMTLGNGNWTFWAVAWEGNGSATKFVGTVRCSKSIALLNGSDVSVTISLSNSTCSSTDFSPTYGVSAGTISFPHISHYECNRLSDHKGRGCGTTAIAKSVSKRFVLSSFRKLKDSAPILTGTKLVSDCMMANSSSGLEQLPIGDGFFPVHTIVESFYSSSTCDETDPKGMRRANYDFGLLGTPRLDTKSFVNEGICDLTGITQAQCTDLGGTWGSGCTLTTPAAKDVSAAKCAAMSKTVTNDPANKQFQLITTIPDAEVCSPERMNTAIATPHVYAAGVGSITSPFVICSEVQLNKIGSSNLGAHYLLANDLDMNKTSGLGSLERPLCYDQDPGANFLPIGSNFTSPPGDCTETTPGNFSGSFNGNNHTIRNIRVHSKASDTGFVRTGGTIKNLVLDTIEIEGSSYVGAVSGQAASLIENVTVKHAKIRGDQYVGGIAGQYSSPSPLAYVRVLDAEIKLENNTSFGGGLIGQLSSAANISRSAFEGIIKTNSSDETLGGLIGQYTGSTSFNIDSSYSSGAVLSSGTNNARAAGLIGYHGSPSGSANITNSYSRMSIGPSGGGMMNGTARLGGLVGDRSSGNVNVTSSFYYGSIMHPCFEAANTSCSNNVNTMLGGNNSYTPVNSAGVMLNGAIFTTTASFSQSSTKAFIETDTTYLSNLLANGFINVGSPVYRLDWETGPCSFLANNQSVANQVTISRGTSTNPIVICHENQWKEIKNYPGKFYVLEDNIALTDFNAATDAPGNFTGTIDGKNHIVSGFYAYVGSTLTGGLFNTVSGTIKNVQFAAGYIEGNAADTIGVFGYVISPGKIDQCKFLAVKIKGSSTTSGVVAGNSNGKLYHLDVDSISSLDSINQGLVTGINSGGGHIYGVRAEGEMQIFNAADPIQAGGITGNNSGLLQEVDTSVRIKNATNSNSGSRIGALAGVNAFYVYDALIRPWAKLDITIAGPKYGQIFGKAQSSSVAKRIVAANEVAVSDLYSSDVYNITADRVAGSSYENTFSLTGSVLKYSAAQPSVSSCSGSAAPYTYTLSGSMSLVYNDGFFMENYNHGYGISSRIIGNTTSTTITTTSPEYNIPCGPGGIQTGSLLYDYQSIPDYIETGINQLTVPSDMENIYTFCPSASADPNLQCASSELDIVEDMPAGKGFNRLINSYKDWILTKEPPAIGTYPVWKLSDEGYPKLFIVD